VVISTVSVLTCAGGLSLCGVNHVNHNS
jgi:hypothetical protein